MHKANNVLLMQILKRQVLQTNNYH